MRDDALNGKYTSGIKESDNSTKTENIMQQLKKKRILGERRRLEALPVDDGRPRLVVLLLADPHLLEGGQGSKDRPADPDGILALGRSDDLDLHRGGREGGDLLLHAVGNAGEHGRASREDGVGVEVLTDVDARQEYASFSTAALYFQFWCYCQIL